MPEHLPTVSRSGIFDSSEHFPGIALTALRPVSVYELELFLEDGGVSYLNSTAYPVRRGNLLLARPGDKRQSAPPFRCFFLHFSFSDSALSAALATLPSLITPPAPAQIEQALREISADAYLEGRSASVRAAGRLLCLLSELLETATESEASLPLAVLDAMRYMKEHFAERITLSDIAARAHLSTVYFHTLFSETVGKTPRQYLGEIRIAAARDLLRAGELSLSDIAELTGFGSQAYFCHRFRESEGLSPGAYRRTFSYPDGK